MSSGLDPAALVAGAYDTRSFRLTPRARMVFAGGRGIRVRGEDTEKLVRLPNGQSVRVSVDGSGKATHIEENHRLHAVARPDVLRIKMHPEAPKPPDENALRYLFRRLAARKG